MKESGLKDYQDEIIDEKAIQLSELQKHHAKVWRLSDTEEKRFIQLKESRSGLYYQGLNLTPIDILGLNARDDDERRRLASRAAQFEAQKVVQNIAWNNAFYKAYNLLFKDIPVVSGFDPSPYSPYAHKALSLSSGDRLFFFIKSDDAVKTVLLVLLDAIKTQSNSQMNLMFVDMNEADIQLWANRHQIPTNLVASGQILLQDATQQYQSLVIKHKKTPLLLLSNGKQSRIVDTGRF